MKKIIALVVSIFLCLPSCHSGSRKAIIYTCEGKIVLKFFPDKAPLTSNNFIRNCTNRVYDGSCFYRVVHDNNQDSGHVKIEVIQGGLFYDSLITNFPLIPHENTDMTGLKHKNGSISMARNEPGSASTEFFICINDQPELNFGGKRNPDGQGFAAFGKVTAGMDIIVKIQGMHETSQYLNQKVLIDSIRLY
jgi:peptidyl-prolyl cis-trans isomerase A (cyclophilin A)